MASTKVDMKVVLLGKEHVGKTCLVCRYLHGKFSDVKAYQSEYNHRLCTSKLAVMAIGSTTVKTPARSFSEPGVLPGEVTTTMKIILLGKANTGKTSITKRFMHDQFTGVETTTIGAAFGAKRVVINGKPIVMGIWDTAGSERYEAMSRIYYRGARAAVVCYDISDKSSFDRVRFWVTELQKNELNCRVYLCGTKKDIVEEDATLRQVDYHDTTDYADDIHAKVFETSSKTGENIENLFSKIADDYAEDLSKPNRGNIVIKDTVDLGRGVSRPQSQCKC